MKRINILLVFVLIAAIGLFGGYIFWIHNNLDTVGPVISIEETLLELSVEDPEEMLLQGVTAVDARDGDVTAQILVESVYGLSGENLTTVTYAAFDSAGNVSKAQRQVRYTDYCPPRFQLNDSLTFTAESGFDLMECVGAYDVLDGDISRQVRATLVSDTERIDIRGNHQVLLQVTNSLGDTAELTLPVTVSDGDWYTAEVELSQYLIYLKRGQSFDPRAYLRSFSVRGETVAVRYNTPAGVVVEIENTVNPNVPGVYEVKYVLSSSVNQVTYSGIAKLIVIVE